MSLESAIADLVSASTQLTQSVNVTRATVEATRDTVIAQEAPVTTAKDATAASATAATTDAATTASKLTAAAADYAAQKTTKGLAAVQTSADSELKDRLHRRDPARHPFRGARPSLVMDFVRQECHRNNAAGNLEQVDLSSFMTFTRGSTATYVGPDGLIKTAGVNEARYGYDPVTGEALGLLVEEQRTNLFRSSNYFGLASSTWSKSGSLCKNNETLGPDGLLSGHKIVESSGVGIRHGIYNVGYSITLGSTGNKTVSFVLKPGERTSISMVAYGTGMTTVSSSAIAIASGTPLSNGFYKVSWTFNVDVVPPTICIELWMLNQSNTLFYDGDGVSGMYIYSAQLEEGAFPTSYIPTPATFTGRASTKTYFDSNGVMQTAANDVAVTDYGYVDGRWVSKGLSLEGQATNLLLQSENFMSSAESLAATVTADNALAPNGQLTADKIDFTADANGKHYKLDYVSNPAGMTYTYSVYLRAATNCVVALRIANLAVAEDAYVTCQLTTEWKRFSVSRGFALTGTQLRMGLDNRAGFGSDGAAKTVYEWGAQLETGPVATSYIPTTTAQVTRAADTSTSAQVTRASESAVSTQAAALYNLEAGTTVVEARQSKRGNYPGMYKWDGDYIVYTHAAGNQIALAGRGNAGTLGFIAPTQDTPIRHAIRRSRGSLAASVNNISTNTVSLGLSTSAVVSSLTVGVGGEPWNGYIKQLTYFPRQLSDADLQALTILED